MNTDDLKTLLQNKTIVDFETGAQDFSHGLRLVLRDTETGELGVLAVEPDSVVLPDENLLFYSYQVIEEPRREPYEECLIFNLQPRLEPDFISGETPLLFGG